MEGDLVAVEARYNLSCIYKLSLTSIPKSGEPLKRGAFGFEVQAEAENLHSATQKV